MREYTRVLKERLPRRCFEPVPKQLIWLIPHGAIISGGIAAIALLHLHWLANVGIALLIGSSFACLALLGHNVLHGSVVRTAWLRNLVGAICFVPFNLGPRLWRRWHNVEHHGHTQDGEQDPDAMGTLDDYLNRPAVRLLYRFTPWTRGLLTFLSFTFWFSLHSFLMLCRYLRAFRRQERPVVLLQFAVPILLWGGLLLLIGPHKFTFAYVVPVLVANFTVMSYISTNHLLNPITPQNDPLANSLTVVLPRWVDVLHHSFSHHTEHHIFPAMNSCYAPRVKALIKELWPERYNEMPHWQALLAIWRTPRLYAAPDTLADPHRGIGYPVLGHGLEAGKVRSFPLDGGKATTEPPVAESRPRLV